MPDITMCTGHQKFTNNICPLRDSCWRHTATPSEYRQSYFVDAPYIEEPDGTSCEYFWKAHNENR